MATPAPGEDAEASATSEEEGGVQGEGDAQAPPLKVRYCAVYDCTNNYKSHPKLSYFGFPSDKAKIKEWVEKIRRPDILQSDGRVSAYYRVCETHFHPHLIKENKRRRRLMRRATPALRLPHAGAYVSVYESPQLGRAEPARPTVFQVKGKALERSTLEVFQYVDETKLAKKKKTVVYRPGPLPAAPPALGGCDCDSHLSPKAADFVKLLTRLQTDQDYFNKCLKLLHSSPQAYRLLRASFGLPTVSVLQSHCIRHLPDFDSTLDLLRTRIDQMSETERHCTLGVEFIDTRPNLFYNITFDRIVGLHEVDGAQGPWVAKRGVAVVAKGLLADWTQPVALCYLARDDDAFNQWIEKIIRHLLAIGLKIHALVCDPTAPAPCHGVSIEQPFFYVDSTKISLIFDPPRLIKMLLFDFMSYDFCFERKRARWRDVLEYRKIEHNKALTLTPGLTDACTLPAAVRRMRPARAARVLSAALAAALASRADQGLLGESARATVNLILKVSNLYDLLSSIRVKGTYFKKGLSQDPSLIEFLKYMKSFFNCLKLEDGYGLDKGATKKLTENWQVTIGAVLALREDLQQLRPYLLTKRLHLADGVGTSAQRAAGSDKPSCQQIFTAFKKQFLHEMQQPTGKRERSVDLNKLLTYVLSSSSLEIQPVEVDDEIRVRAHDYRCLRVPKRGSLAAIALHLLRAAARVHGDCQLAADYLHAPPQPDFLQLVSDLDAALTGALSEGAAARSLLRDLLMDVHVLDCFVPCECFPLDYLKRLFFRLRLYRLLRQNQKRFKNGEVDLEINSLK